MSVVVFFTPAHAALAASAHASVIPLIALVPIIVTPDKLLCGGLVADAGLHSFFAKQRPRAITNAGSAVTYFVGGAQGSSRLLVDSAGEEPAVHREQVTRDESCRIGREKYRRASELLGLAEATHRRSQQQLPTAIRTVEQALIQCGAKHPRQNGVHTHAVVRPLDRQRFGQGGDTGFAGAVRRD